MPTVAELGSRIKAKYPGSYGDLPDAEVGSRAKAKYPGSYDDFVDVPAERGPSAISNIPMFPMMPGGPTVGQASGFFPAAAGAVGLLGGPGVAGVAAAGGELARQKIQGEDANLWKAGTEGVMTTALAGAPAAISGAARVAGKIPGVGKLAMKVALHGKFGVFAPLIEKMIAKLGPQAAAEAAPAVEEAAMSTREMLGMSKSGNLAQQVKVQKARQWVQARRSDILTKELEDAGKFEVGGAKGAGKVVGEIMPAEGRVPIDVQGKPGATRAASQRGVTKREIALRQKGMAESGTAAPAPEIPAETDLAAQMKQSLEFEREMTKRGFSPAQKKLLRRGAHELIQGGAQQ